MLLEFKAIWLHDLFLKAIVHMWRDFQNYLWPRSKAINHILRSLNSFTRCATRYSNPWKGRGVKTLKYLGESIPKWLSLMCWEGFLKAHFDGFVYPHLMTGIWWQVQTLSCKKCLVLLQLVPYGEASLWPYKAALQQCKCH